MNGVTERTTLMIVVISLCQKLHYRQIPTELFIFSIHHDLEAGFGPNCLMPNQAHRPLLVCRVNTPNVLKGLVNRQHARHGTDVKPFEDSQMVFR